MTAEAPATPRASIDVRGKTISTFVVYEALSRLRGMADGEVLEIVAEPFSPIDSDIAAWCRMTGHHLLHTGRHADRHVFHVQKAAAAPAHQQTLALVVSDAGLEEILSPLGFALAAALTGDRVHIYFQGPAVRVLKRGFREKLGGLSRPFSAFARRGLARAGHIPPQEKLHQLRELDARFYVCGPSMQHFGVSLDEFIFDDVTVCEYLTFLEVIRSSDTAIMLQ
jgi:predicted peroxiredoxin/TusA-related sulfurtransferase